MRIRPVIVKLTGGVCAALGFFFSEAASKGSWVCLAGCASVTVTAVAVTSTVPQSPADVCSFFSSYIAPLSTSFPPKLLLALLRVPTHDPARLIGRVVFGRRVPVSVPNGCLLVQAGKQLERLTGGHVLAGFHEVLHVQYRDLQVFILSCTDYGLMVQGTLVVTCRMWI